jgi:two-component system response regulator
MAAEIDANEHIILLVEDNPDDQELTMRALKKNNIQNRVVIANDGAEALDYLFAQGQHADRDSASMPRLILLDLKLPKVDGIELLQRIRKDPRTRRIPVVVLTSSGQARDIMTCYDHGANSFIRKPVDFNTFTDSVRQIGQYWLALNITIP